MICNYEEILINRVRKDITPITEFEQFDLLDIIINLIDYSQDINNFRIMISKYYYNNILNQNNLNEIDTLFAVKLIVSKHLLDEEIICYDREGFECYCDESNNFIGSLLLKERVRYYNSKQTLRKEKLKELGL